MNSCLKPGTLQAAIVAMSWALYKTVQPQLPAVVAGIGPSLGEYSALLPVVALHYDALRLVKLRGELMQNE